MEPDNPVHVKIELLARFAHDLSNYQKFHHIHVLRAAGPAVSPPILNSWLLVAKHAFSTLVLSIKIQITLSL